MCMFIIHEVNNPNSVPAGMEKCGSPVGRDNQEILLGNLTVLSSNLGCPVPSGQLYFSGLKME